MDRYRDSGILDRESFGRNSESVDKDNEKIGRVSEQLDSET